MVLVNMKFMYDFFFLNVVYISFYFIKLYFMFWVVV